MSGRQAFFAWTLAVIGLGGLWGTFSVAQPVPVKKAAVDLVPGSSTAAFAFRGIKGMEAEFEQTAVYRSLVDSGLLAVVLKAAAFGADGAPAEVTDPLKALGLHVGKHGVAGGIVLTGEGEGTQVTGHLVFPELGSSEPTVREFIAKMTRNRVEWTTKKDGTRTITQGTVEGQEVAWWAEGAHLCVAIGKGAVEIGLKVAADSSLGLGKTGRLGRMKVEQGGSSFFQMTADMRKVWGAMESASIPNGPDQPSVKMKDIIDAVGLTSFTEMEWAVSVKGEAIVSQSRMAIPGPKVGFAKLFTAPAIGLGDLPPIPLDAQGFYAASLDLSGLFNEAIATVNRVAAMLPEKDREQVQVDAFLEQMNGTLGFDLDKDLLAALGPVWTFHDDPKNGFFGFGVLGAVSVRDGKKLKETATTILERLQPALDRENIKVERKGGPIDTISIQIGGSPITPAIGISDKWFVVGMQPQAIKTFFLRADKKLPTWKVDKLPTDSQKIIPEKFTSLQVSNPQGAYSLLLSYAPMGINMASAEFKKQGRDFPIAVEDVPAAEVVTAPMFTNVSVITSDDTGTVSYSRDSVPAGIPVPMLSGGSGTATAAVMVALLLPAVQQAREAARRSQSRNNLKQIGLALHNYHDNFSHFPQGTVEEAEDLKIEKRLSWMAKLLPYLDQLALYHQLDVAQSWDSEKNRDTTAISIQAYHNPSYPTTEKTASHTHYVGIAGVGAESLTSTEIDEKSGVFGYNRKTRIQDMRDGTSNTIMVTEGTDKAAGPWGQGGKSTIRALTRKPYANGPDGLGGPSVGGFNVLMGDGSVRFVSDKVDPELLEKLSTIAGGEVIEGF